MLEKFRRAISMVPLTGIDSLQEEMKREEPEVTLLA